MSGQDSMIAVKRFVGIIGGEEKVFNAGDKITKAEAKELRLTEKPDIAKKEAPKK